MGIIISRLSAALREIAKELDNQGNQNNEIDGSEVSVFKAASAFMVLKSKASDKEYMSIFGTSALQEWKQTSKYKTNKYSKPITEYKDQKGNIMRCSINGNDIDVYTESQNGAKGYYSKEIVMLPEEE